MCLNLDQPEKRIAENDIEVIKVILRDKNTGKLISPVFESIYEPGKEKTEDLKIILDGFSFPKEEYRTSSGLYSYYKETDPKICKATLCAFGNNNLEAWKAVIRKGSEYVVSGSQFCSNRLTIISKIC